MLAAMYYFSTDLFSGENTRGAVEIVLAWFVNNPTPRMISRANYAARKAAHFVEYGFLALLLFRAFRADSSVRWRLSWAIYSICIVMAWAVLDEYHQTLTTRRGGSLYDAMLDSSGGLFAMVLTGLINWKRAVRRTRTN